MRKLSKRALWGILFYSATITVPAPAAPSAPPSETLLCPGLSQPVEIIKDRWGISHIYAKSEGDLFFAQGYNVARDPAKRGEPTTQLLSSYRVPLRSQ